MIHGMVLMFDPPTYETATAVQSWKPTCLCGWLSLWVESEYEAHGLWQDHFAEAMGFASPADVVVAGSIEPGYEIDEDA